MVRKVQRAWRKKATLYDARKEMLVRAWLRMAMLFASVAPDVNTTFSASAPTARATCARACSMAAFVRTPSVCLEDGLPKWSHNHGSIAERTSASVGVVAA